MEASRVVVPLEQTQFEALSPKKKHQLREEAVIELVRRKPYMSHIRTDEIAAAMQTPHTGWASQFIRALVKRGVLIKHEISPHKFAYTIPSAVRTTQPAYPPELSRVQTGPAEEETPSTPETSPASEPQTVRQLAERYFVASFGNTDFDEFIDWCDHKGY